MILGKVLKEFRDGKVRTLPDLASKLDITTDELKNALDILVATGKLRKTKQSVSNNTSCNTCSSSCSNCSGCMTASKVGNEIAERNALSFYEII